MTVDEKLPSLIIEFRDGVAWSVYYHRPIRAPYEYKKYTPAKPAKTCSRREVPGSNLVDTGCGNTVTDFFRVPYCAWCGRKIKVKDDDEARLRGRSGADAGRG